MDDRFPDRKMFSTNLTIDWSSSRPKTDGGAASVIAWSASVKRYHVANGQFEHGCGRRLACRKRGRLRHHARRFPRRAQQPAMSAVTTPASANRVERIARERRMDLPCNYMVHPGGAGIGTPIATK